MQDDETTKPNEAAAQPPTSQPQPVITGSPNVSPVPSSGQPVASPTLASKKSKKRLLLAILAIVLLLAAGGAFAAYNYLNNKPEKVLADALTNTVSDLLERKPTSTVGTVTFESKNDSNIKVVIKFDGKSNGDNGEGNADITVSAAEQTFNVKTSARIFGDEEFYVKVENLKQIIDSRFNNQLDTSNFRQAIDPLVTKIDNQWIKVTKADLKQYGVTDEETIDKCSNAVQSLRLSSNDKKQLKKLFRENQFVVASEKFGNEKVADETSFHYKLDFNSKAGENFAKQVIAMESLKTVKKDCGIDDKDLEDGFKENRQTTSRNKDSTKPVVELWVGKSSRRPTKFRVSADNKTMTFDFSTQIKLDDKNVSIEKPADSISVNELKAEFEKLMPSSTTNLQSL